MPGANVLNEKIKIIGDNSQRDFLKRSCRAQRFNPNHLMLVHNLQIQAFPLFVTFVLPRIDLRPW